MSGKQDLEKILNGLIPDQPPHWELVFQNVACNMLQDTNEHEIRTSVQYCMKHGGIGKPYIFSTSNCIFKGMPPESYRIMRDEYLKLCKTDDSVRLLRQSRDFSR